MEEVLEGQREDLFALNDMATAIAALSDLEQKKLTAVMEMAKPECAGEIRELAKNLELFEFAPKVRTPAEYGRYMIQDSGHYEYDPNLEEFYDYERYGKLRMEKETGAFTEKGYVAYGYIAETENYRFCLRCTPFPGEYQGYLYCYDLCQQEMYRQEHPVVGRVTFASGEQQEFTDSKALLQAIREELPFRSTTGFRFETLTDDPEVKKAVDDILLDFAGEDNSRRTCNYGLTETGKQALRKAADPSIPHTYAWFVMADTNTPQEIIRQDLTLEEAIQIYQDSNTSEKRLGVIKDGIATVDFVHFQSGEQQFFTDHEKLESFRSDLVVAEAMERLYAGYVSGKEATAYLPPALVAAMRGTVQDSENRIARLLFKLAVEVNMMMNVLAAGMEISDEDLKTLRARSVREVKQTNGRISFKDAIDYQRGVE